MSTAEKLITPDEFAAMPDSDRYELVDGRLVEREMSIYTNRIAEAVYVMLLDYSRRAKSGKAKNDGYTYCCFPHKPNLVRKPDASWFSTARWASVDKSTAHLGLAPDLVVEVASPNDNVYDLVKRVNEFLKAGTQEAWVVYPEEREIERRYPKGRAQWYEGDEVLDGAPMLPGFTLKLDDLLASLP